ncbi:MAG TPA: hypothetical protein VFS32_04960 [Candidatus Limnocylindrales bacterium]|nr:hypothetical protein [Candidatus Limnocylindrales bacterium]
MAEILTESFCERCGTRYTFQAAAPRRQRLGKVKVLSKGLRKYVLDDSTTLDEAFAEARSDEEREISSHQVEAFHQTFNFCLTCRQYTCANCWNEAEGRCLTCAPNLSQEILPTAFPTLGTTIAPPPETNGHDLASAADLVWPTIDLRRLEDAGGAADAGATGGVDADAADEPGATADEPLTADLDDEAFDSTIAARLDALAGPATEPATSPEASETLEALEGPEAPEAAAAGGAVEAVTPPATVPGATEPVERAEEAVDVPLDVLEAVRAKAAAEEAAEQVAEDSGIGAHHEAEHAGVEAGPIAEREPETPVVPEGPAVEPPPTLAEPPALPAAADPADRAAAAAARTAWLLSQFRPGSDEEAEAPGAEPAAVADEPARIEPVPPTAEPGRLEPVTEAAPESAPAPPAAADESTSGRDDRVELPTWSIVAPIDAETPLEPAHLEPAEPTAGPTAQPALPEPAAPNDVRWPAPAWPSTPESAPVWTRPAAERPSWPQPDPVNLAPRPAGGTSGLWAESSREVLSRNGGTAATGVQACVNCGLPLSATARFCRRCGSAQATA